MQYRPLLTAPLKEVNLKWQKLPKRYENFKSKYPTPVQYQGIYGFYFSKDVSPLFGSKEPFISTTKLTNICAYIAALHEIGHGYHGHNRSCRDVITRAQLAEECVAWLWAFENMQVPFTKRASGFANFCIGTYIRDCKFKRAPSELVRLEKEYGVGRPVIYDVSEN